MQQVFSGMQRLIRFTLYFPHNMKIMLIRALVLFLVNYCAVVVGVCWAFGQTSASTGIQYYCVRFVFNLCRFDHVSPLFNRNFSLTSKELKSFNIPILLCTAITTKYKKNKTMYYEGLLSAHNVQNQYSYIIASAIRSVCF